MPEGIFIERAGFRTWLKWHRGRRQQGDIPFTRNRILQGMQDGASVEIDLVCHAGGGFAVLHDETLDRDTTGAGPVRDASADDLRSLSLRDSNGHASPHPVLLLDDLCHLLQDVHCNPDAILQLDLKETAASLSAADIAAFAEAVTPVTDRIILSGGDAVAVEQLLAIVSDLKVGYDPCHDGAVERLMESRDFSGFVSGALAAVPKAGMIYLEARLVLFAQDHGYDLVNAFHQAGKSIDAYTIRKADADSLLLVQRLLALKCDQITTDDPVGLERLLA